MKHTPTDIPLRCACGKLQGLAIDVAPHTGTRLLCYCGDCQAFARFLGQRGILDEHGGSDIFQLTPAQVRLTRGVEQLRAMRLSDKGLLRWYADCCRTPVGNTLTQPRVPFVGMLHSFMDHAQHGRSRDSVLGPLVAKTQAHRAIGTPPPDAFQGVPARIILRNLRLALRASLLGKHRPTPFFDEHGRLRVEPRVLSRTERTQLTPVRAS
ncbi:MAG: DUF6151 family protein [Polyangiales bacterium]